MTYVFIDLKLHEPKEGVFNIGAFHNDWVGRGTANYKYLMEVYLFDFILGVDMPEPKLCTVCPD